jgi:hypothetical protein
VNLLAIVDVHAVVPQSERALKPRQSQNATAGFRPLQDFSRLLPYQPCEVSAFARVIRPLMIGSVLVGMVPVKELSVKRLSNRMGGT